MRLVDDDQVVVSPIERFEIQFAGPASDTGHIRVVENVVVEAVVGKQVAAVVDRVNGPIVSQLLRAKNQDSVVTQLVVLDDGQCFKRLAKADTVGNDAAVVLLDLVNRTEHTITLEAIQLAPYQRILNSGTSFDDLVFLDLAQHVAKDIVEREEVQQVGRLIGVKLS